jgi:DNA-binding transcriptional regulator YiaG
MTEILALKRVHRLARTGRLAELREALGLSQADIARAIGVRQSTVARWESGDIHPRGHHAVALLEVLEVDGQP